MNGFKNFAHGLVVFLEPYSSSFVGRIVGRNFRSDGTERTKKR